MNPNPEDAGPNFENTPDQPASTFELSVRRIQIWTAILGAASSVAALAFWDARSSAGLLMGAILSAVNFHLLKRLAQSIGGGGEAGASGSSRAVGFGIRFLVLGAAMFVIMRILEVGPLPVLLGLLIPAGAVLVECVHLLAGALSSPKGTTPQ